jgi:hypothetical protein
MAHVLTTICVLKNRMTFIIGTKNKNISKAPLSNIHGMTTVGEHIPIAHVLTTICVKRYNKVMREIPLVSILE